MITVEKELVVAQDMERVWEFVSQMGNWANQMPGYIAHEQINDDESIWTLQINMGPFTRPVIMDVCVVEWAAPAVVKFNLKGQFDPFHGSGMFRAEPHDAGTRIHLQFAAEATGSMGKVLTAMAIPVLKKVAEQFSANLARVLA